MEGHGLALQDTAALEAREGRQAVGVDDQAIPLLLYEQALNDLAWQNRLVCQLPHDLHDTLSLNFQSDCTLIPGVMAVRCPYLGSMQGLVGDLDGLCDLRHVKSALLPSSCCPVLESPLQAAHLGRLAVHEHDVAGLQLVDELARLRKVGMCREGDRINCHFEGHLQAD